MEYGVQTLLALGRQGSLEGALRPALRRRGFRRGLSRQHDSAGAPTCGRGTKKNGQQSIGRSRGGLSTKIHAAVDGLGNLARFRLTGGQRHDITEAENLIEDMQNVGAVVADKAFDAASLLTRIAAMKATAVIPPKANRKVFRSYDKHVYKSRNLIERFFARLKQFRRVATRYDKLDIRFEAFISITAALIWLA